MDKQELRRIKEEIAELILRHGDMRIDAVTHGIVPTGYTMPMEVADLILAIKGIRIEAKSQNLPKNPYSQDYQSSNGDFYDAIEDYKKDVKNSGFVRVLPKKE